MQLRVDYVTKDGVRGIWDFEAEYDNLAQLEKQMPSTLDYARQRMPEIVQLEIVQVRTEEKTLLVYKKRRKRS